ncbi:hypothetical protein ACA910_012264 [Epithemia clementina (nom. ined.)]
MTTTTSPMRIPRYSTRCLILTGLFFMVTFLLTSEQQYLAVVDSSSARNNTTTQTACRHDDSIIINNHNDDYLHNKPLHVVLALSGNHSGFFSELEVALKSILLNAPLDRNLTVHFLADGPAHAALHHGLFHKDRSPSMMMTQWVSRSPIVLQTYNVESHLENWTTRIAQLYRQTGFAVGLQSDAFTKHTIGTWFRLFCHEVILPHHPTADSVVYMDVDVVITANLEALVQQSVLLLLSPEERRVAVKEEEEKKIPVNHNNNHNSTNTHDDNDKDRPQRHNNDDDDDDYYFQWGALKCAGFMILNLRQLSNLWTLVSSLNLNQFSQVTKDSMSDQLVFRALTAKHEKVVAPNLPVEWDIHIADGSWRVYKQFPKVYQNLGMMHYNGGGSSQVPYWQTPGNSAFYFHDPALQNGVGMTRHYIYLPWIWARSQAASQTTLPHHQFALQLVQLVHAGDDDDDDPPPLSSSSHHHHTNNTTTAATTTAQYDGTTTNHTNTKKAKRRRTRRRRR